MKRSRLGRRRGRGPAIRRPLRAPAQTPLYQTTDRGRGIVIDPTHFVAPAQRGGGWGPFAKSFLRMNEAALRALDIVAQPMAGPDGVVVRLVPGGRAGAVPLRSPQTGQVRGGVVVRPRFGWAGVGRVLDETGWHCSPEFLELPLVPGSGREVPPWVLGGPVLARLAELLRTLRRGYRETEEVLRKPRGRILWNRYCSESLVRGHWDRLPCRFPDLAVDDILRSAVRWTVERVRSDLLGVTGPDRIAVVLVAVAKRLLETLSDVPARPPVRRTLDTKLGSVKLQDAVLRAGVEAMGWVIDERGLGGGRELDGLAWALPLDRVWEGYVESMIRREVTMIGGTVRVGRLRETVVPVLWTDPTHRSLGHLEPDIVVTKGRRVWIVDAKYKAHLADLDETGWREFADQARSDHRADIHQVLAYAALFDADEVTATLVYPLRQATWTSLRHRRRDVSRAEILHHGRKVHLELRGLPFGHGSREP